jgi:hypothetical protein
MKTQARARPGSPAKPSSVIATLRNVSRIPLSGPYTSARRQHQSTWWRGEVHPPNGVKDDRHARWPARSGPVVIRVSG